MSFLYCIDHNWSYMKFFYTILVVLESRHPYLFDDILKSFYSINTRENHAFEVGLQFCKQIMEMTLLLFKLVGLLFYLSFSYYYIF